MKIPSEEQIEAVISEVLVHALETAETPEEIHKDNCDYCRLVKELFERDVATKDSGVCALHEMVRAISSTDPFTTMVINMARGAGLVGTLINVANLAFLIGLKANEAMNDEEKLKELYRKGE